MFTKAYSSVNSITAQEIVYFLQDLIEAYPNKTLMVIWDNARTHTAQIVRDFAALHEDKLHLIFQPPYSPQLNPQENIWKWFKDECAQSNAYKNEKELQHRTDEFFSHANSHPQEVKSHAWARSFYK